MSKTARPAPTRKPRTAPSAKVANTPRPRSKKPAVKGRSPKSAITQQTAPEKKAASPRLPADVKLAIAAAQDKLAVDLTVLDLRNATAFTDFFIVCTGTNTKQVQAIADAVEASLRSAGQKPALVEGY